MDCISNCAKIMGYTPVTDEGPDINGSILVYDYDSYSYPIWYNPELESEQYLALCAKLGITVSFGKTAAIATYGSTSVVIHTDNTLEGKMRAARTAVTRLVGQVYAN